MSTKFFISGFPTPLSPLIHQMPPPHPPPRMLTALTTSTVNQIPLRCERTRSTAALYEYLLIRQPRLLQRQSFGRRWISGYSAASAAKEYQGPRRRLPNPAPPPKKKPLFVYSETAVPQLSNEELKSVFSQEVGGFPPGLFPRTFVEADADIKAFLVAFRISS